MYWLNRVHKRIERAWMDGRHHDPHCFKDDTSEIIATAALTLDQVMLLTKSEHIKNVGLLNQNI